MKKQISYCFPGTMLMEFQKKSILAICALFFILISRGQAELNYPETVYGPEHIQANWITHNDAAGGSDEIILFRNSFEIDNPQDDFIINISADNHYFLFVNGTYITHGPQLSDIEHWKYETLNLKTYLHKGINSIAIKVVNFGKRRFLGFQSLHTSLLVNGITKNAKILNTTGNNQTWKTRIDPSYKAIEINWRGEGEKSIVGGFYANNPTDFVDMNLHPTGWTRTNYDDTSWQHPIFYESGSSMGGAIGYLLEPRNLPLLTWDKEMLGPIVRSSTKNSSNFPNQPLEISPNSKIKILIDHKVVSNGYPELLFSKGKDASIKIKYAENLFGSKNEKGDRNAIINKELKGYYDHIISNGENQKFIPNWMRTFRFIEFEIETKSQPLILNKFFNNRSRSQLPSTAKFSTDNQMYNDIFEICKRTVDICTQDYFLSDAYYEAMQYVGDSKIQSLLWQTFSGNLDHTKNAIRQFHHSRTEDGTILGAYPMRSTFIYPTYSLVWVDMIYDYYKLTGNKSLIAEYKNGIVHTLSGFEKNMNDLHLVNKTKYRYFIDWYVNPPHSGAGTATDNNGENSAVVSLHYAYALQKAATIFKELGELEIQQEYLERAEQIKDAVRNLCYSKDKKMFAERPDKTVYDQHTNIMAVLTNTVPQSEQKELIERILTDNTLLQATYYYRYYLFEAIKKVDAPELFDKAQKPWEEMIHNNMTTTLERFESETKPTRSEVHPWSASPAYFYFNYLAGIESLSENYKSIRIKPRFGKLNIISGTLPTSRGAIKFKMEKKGSKLTAEIHLPEKVTGTFVWESETVPLNKVLNRISLK